MTDPYSDRMTPKQRGELRELRRYEVRGGFVYDRKAGRLATADECRNALEAISSFRAISAGMDFSQAETDDHGRRDLCGGPIVPLIFVALVVAGGLILWGLL